MSWNESSVSWGWDCVQEAGPGPGQPSVLQEASVLGRSHFPLTLDLLAVGGAPKFETSLLKHNTSQSPLEPATLGREASQSV